MKYKRLAHQGFYNPNLLKKYPLGYSPQVNHYITKKFIQPTRIIRKKNYINPNSQPYQYSGLATTVDPLHLTTTPIIHEHITYISHPLDAFSENLPPVNQIIYKNNYRDRDHYDDISDSMNDDIAYIETLVDNAYDSASDAEDAEQNAEHQN